MLQCLVFVNRAVRHMLKIVMLQFDDSAILACVIFKAIHVV